MYAPADQFVMAEHTSILYWAMQVFACDHLDGRECMHIVCMPLPLFGCRCLMHMQSRHTRKLKFGILACMTAISTAHVITASLEADCYCLCTHQIQTWK